MTTYSEFIASKALVAKPCGIEGAITLSDCLSPFQKACTEWALRRGRSALFEDCGLGKTRQQIEWARIVANPRGEIEGFIEFETPSKENPDKGGIHPSDTLQGRSAREHKDERHICPLQLPIIERAINLWTNPGDLVFSPFAGIGSEGYVALKLKRRFLGVELKRSYWDQAKANLASAESLAVEQDLFSNERAA